ncbi:MAG: metallophosphoesterase [Eubacterium sp.]|nr:metallophosphoesterase [Eubacterium sp.]
MIYYTSDTHLGHENVIKHCNRPFKDAAEMDRTLISNWNSRVTDNDDVYVLGDMMFRNKTPAEEYLRKLRGKKHLIIGNHDRSWMPKCDYENYFESVDNLLYIVDGGRQVVLCHYPMMDWPHKRSGGYMVFGHIHNNTVDEYWPLIRRSEVMFNAGVDVNNYMPVTFEEMVINNKLFKEGIAQR